MNHKHINISTLQLDVEQEFLAKLKLLTPYFESRMNGATAHQMQSIAPADQKYKLNYGISLGDMKLLAESIKSVNIINFTRVDYDKLWCTNIREAMLLALLNTPENLITPDRISSWIASTPTQEMAELLPFLFSWKSTDPEKTLSLAINSYPTSPTIQRIAYTYTIGRLIQHNKLNPSSNDIQSYISLTKSNTPAPQEATSINFLTNILSQ
ncbi:MAG: hypothetical protein MJZ27_07795 [Bacteroidales bacterium]|nr:hypothetical protein [Bacteroidales bacterium]